jgi:hypothetical protein
MLSPDAGRRAAIITAIGLALFAPIFMAVLPSAGLEQNDFSDPAKLGTFVHAHFAVFAIPYIDGLVLHVAGIVAVVAVTQHLRKRSPWIALAAIGGLGWMVLDIAQNGTGIYASHEIVRHSTADAGSQLVLVGQLTTGLRLAGHVLGGLWVLTVGVVALRHGGLSRAVGWLGAFAGALMTVNVVAPVTQMPLFVLLPLWFILVGIGLGTVDEQADEPSRELLGSLT